MDPTPATTHGNEPEESHGKSEPLPHHPVPYFKIFFILVALTIVTVLLNSFHYDNEIVNVLLALTVASIKAAFVAMFFMHLKFEGKLIYIIFLVPCVLCVILVLALIPDIVHGRMTAFNDMVGYFEKFLGGHG